MFAANNKATRFAVPLLCLSVLAACGGQDKAGGSPNAQSADKPDIASQPAELTIYDSSGNKLDWIMDNYGNKLKEKFPNYKITIVPQDNAKSLENLISSGGNADIVTSATGSIVFDMQMQSDISDLIAKYKYDLSKLEPTTVEIQKKLANGGLYALPAWTTTGVLFYNKDIFDKFGVPYPKDGMTWDDIYELAKKTTRMDNNVQYRGLSMAFEHIMMLNQLGAAHIDLSTNKSLFTADNFKKAFENLVRFYQIPGNGMPGNKFFFANEQDPFYKNNTIAMFMTLHGGGRTYKDSVNWDTVTLPILKDKPEIGSQSYPNFFFLSKTSKNRDAAFQVLSYLTSNEFQQFVVRNGYIPILKDQSIAQQIGADIPEYKGKNIKAALPKTFAPPTIKTKYQSIANTETSAALNAVVSGTDVNTALREAGERVDKKIAAQLGAK
ncbi:extracellular solute-binding protein [Paenibacillus hemerocallicola]|uniref:Extracellular solute-binding protein n=1 Tax=Paenibacillus hemerocallicola TaxID=1172614 RepID=A0A5C4SZQ9_9BACL|nr:extracellular solute-binding protein [Paenibacillus hemerocallicola]TNJ61995.1 extracellular solute-binding protein [Paenibacillus hemerocallicola]